SRPEGRPAAPRVGGRRPCAGEPADPVRSSPSLVQPRRPAFPQPRPRPQPQTAGPTHSSSALLGPGSALARNDNRTPAGCRRAAELGVPSLRRRPVATTGSRLVETTWCLSTNGAVGTDIRTIQDGEVTAYERVLELAFGEIP